MQVTPNGLVSLSVKSDLTTNTLTPAVPTSVVIKRISTAPVAGSCNNSAGTAGTLVTGMAAWFTTIHANPPPVRLGDPLLYTPRRTAFTVATLSPAELARMSGLCSFIISNGSGFGICRSCRTGALGGIRQ